MNSRLAPILISSIFAVACGSSSKEQQATKAPESTPSAVTSPANAGTANPVAPSETPVKVGDKTKCPVSGEEFTVAESTPRVTYEGKDYYFCCPSCAEEFKANPKKYVK